MVWGIIIVVKNGFVVSISISLLFMDDEYVYALFNIYSL